MGRYYEYNGSCGCSNQGEVREDGEVDIIPLPNAGANLCQLEQCKEVIQTLWSNFDKSKSLPIETVEKILYLLKQPILKDSQTGEKPE